MAGTRVVAACLAAWACYPALLARWGVDAEDAVEGARHLRDSCRGASAKVAGAAMEVVGRLVAEGKLFTLGRWGQGRQGACVWQ